MLQDQIRPNRLIGVEIYSLSSMRVGEQDDMAFNFGTVFDFNEHHHLPFSAGRPLDGQTDFQMYIAYQFTFGPEWFHCDRVSPQPLAGVNR